MSNEVNTLSPKGKLILVTSTSGGVGKTTFASNLAVGISKMKKEVLILDTSFQFSDLYLFFNNKYNYNIKDVIDNIDEMDIKTLALYLTQYKKKGLYVLPGPESPEKGDEIEADKYIELVRKLLNIKEYILIDMNNIFSEINIRLLDMADYIYLISTPNLNTVLSTEKYMQILKKMDIEHKASVVINKYTIKRNLSKGQISSVFENQRNIYLPRKDSDIEKSINVGTPIVYSDKNTDFSKKILNIAKEIVG